MSTWQEKPIRFLGKVITGKTPPKADSRFFNDGEYCFVSPRDISWDQYYVYQTETRVTEVAIQKYKNQVIPKDAVMFTSLSFGFGKLALASKSCLTNQQINSVVTNEQHDAKFVFYLLQQYRPIIFSYNSGIDTPIVPKSVFESIPVKCPELKEQQKIAAILSSYDDLIENNKRRITLLENMTEEIYREWFVRFRFPGWQEAEFEKGLPVGWASGHISHFLRVLSGGTPKSGKSAFWGDSDDIPFFTPKDAPHGFYVSDTEKHITESGLASCNSRLYGKHTIFITARGTVGKLGLAARDMAMNQSCYALVPKDDRYHLFHFLALKHLMPQVKGVSKSGVFDNIVVDTFDIVDMLVPAEEILDRFQDVVSPIFTQLENLMKSMEILEKTKNQLLPRLISGKLSVENLDIQLPPSMQSDQPDRADEAAA